MSWLKLCRLAAVSVLLLAVISAALGEGMVFGQGEPSTVIVVPSSTTIEGTTTISQTIVSPTTSELSGQSSVSSTTVVPSSSTLSGSSSPLTPTVNTVSPTTDAVTPSGNESTPIVGTSAAVPSQSIVTLSWVESTPVVGTSTVRPQSMWSPSTSLLTLPIVGDASPPETQITTGPSGITGCNNIAFAWTGSDDLTPTSWLVYSYYLEGYDSGWSAWMGNTTREYTALPDGTYTFKVKAKDWAQLEGTPDQRPFTVGIPANQPPAPPTSLAQLEKDWQTKIDPVGAQASDNTIVFKAVVSDPNDDQVRLEVELRRVDEYGGQFDDDETKGGLKQSELVTSGSEAYAVASELIGADYHWRARAVDACGEAGEWVDFGNNTILDADFVVPPNQPPHAAFTHSPAEPKVGQWVSFDAGLSREPDGSIEVYEWDFDSDGKPERVGAKNESEETYIWYKPGTYSVTLTVTDDDGAKDNYTSDIVVKGDRFLEKLWSKVPFTTKLRSITDDDLKRIKHELNIYQYPYPEKSFYDKNSDRNNNPGSNVDFYYIHDEVLKRALDTEIDGQTAPRLTYGIYILDALSEVDQAEAAWTQQAKQKLSEIFNRMLGRNASWSTVVSPGAKQAVAYELTTHGSKLAAAATSMLWLSYDVAKIAGELKAFERTHFYGALYRYLQLRAAPYTHDVAWPAVQQFGGWAGQDERVHTKDQNKLNKLEEYFQHLWDVYGTALEKNQLDAFRLKLKNKLREILHSVVMKRKPALVDYQVIGAMSPVELRVYDSQGNVAGLVNGNATEQIPYSIYGDSIQTVVIFSPTDSYRYEVVGTGEGTYGLGITFVEDAEGTDVILSGVPIGPGVAHEYTVQRLAYNPVGPTLSGWHVIGRFADITTTATYSSPITVGIGYDESGVTNEASLRLFHWDGNVWEEVTTWVDMVNNMVYGQVTTLSPFFVGSPVGAGAPGAPGAMRVPVFPNLYVGIAAALGAGILAYWVRRRLVLQG